MACQRLGVQQLWLQTTTSCPAATDAHTGHPLLDSNISHCQPATRPRPPPVKDMRQQQQGYAEGGGRPPHKHHQQVQSCHTLPCPRAKGCARGTKHHLLVVVRSSCNSAVPQAQPCQTNQPPATPTQHKLAAHTRWWERRPRLSAAAHVCASAAAAALSLPSHLLPHILAPAVRPCCCLVLAHAMPPRAAFAVGYCHMRILAATATADLVTALRPCCCRLLVRGSSGLIHTQSRRSGQAGRCA